MCVYSNAIVLRLGQVGELGMRVCVYMCDCCIVCYLQVCDLYSVVYVCEIVM